MTVYTPFFYKREDELPVLDFNQANSFNITPKRPVIEEYKKEFEITPPEPKPELKPIIAPGRVDFSRKDIDVGNMKDLLDIFSKNGINVRVTSGFRNNDKTKSGNLSWHAQGHALDITPVAGESFESLWDQIVNNKEVLDYMKRSGYGILDETTPEMLAKTGGTGAHLHIGKDKSAVSWLNNILQKRGIAKAKSGLKVRKYNKDDSYAQRAHNWFTDNVTTPETYKDGYGRVRVQESDRRENESERLDKNKKDIKTALEIGAPYIPSWMIAAGNSNVSQQPVIQKQKFVNPASKYLTISKNFISPEEKPKIIDTKRILEQPFERSFTNIQNNEKSLNDRLLKKYNITSNDLVNDPKKAIKQWNNGVKYPKIINNHLKNVKAYQVYQKGGSVIYTPFINDTPSPNLMEIQEPYIKQFPKIERSYKFDDQPTDIEYTKVYQSTPAPVPKPLKFNWGQIGDEFKSSMAISNHNKDTNIKNLDYIYYRLLQGGLSEKQSTAIMSHIAKESGGDPRIKEIGNSKKGEGLIQWTFSTRKEGLKNFKPSETPQGVDPELHKQIEYLLYELKDPSKWLSKTYYEKFFNSDDLDTIIENSSIGIIGHADQTREIVNRQKFAKRLLELSTR